MHIKHIKTTDDNGVLAVLCKDMCKVMCEGRLARYLKRRLTSLNVAFSG